MPFDVATRDWWQSVKREVKGQMTWLMNQMLSSITTHNWWQSVNKKVKGNIIWLLDLKIQVQQQMISDNQ